jgi:proton glutamate symport protein
VHACFGKSHYFSGLMRFKLHPVPVMLLLFFAAIITWYFDAPYWVHSAFRWSAELLLLIHAIRKKSITVWIAAAMILGGEFGYLFPQIGGHLKVAGKVFIQLIKTVIAPLLFATLVVGIAGHSEIRQVGRLGWKSLLYFEVVTTAALFIGLLAINLSGAGKGIPKPEFARAGETVQSERIAVESRDDGQLVFKVDGKLRDVNAKPNPEKQNWEKILLHTFPENIAKSVAEGQILQVVVFSIFFGLALAMLGGPTKSVMLEWCESLSAVMFKFTHIVMYFAPIGVFGAVAHTIATMGFDVVAPLLKLVATLYVALVIFIFGVLLPIALLIKLPVKQFIRAISEPVGIAFASASSEAALPKAMENMEKLGVPRKIVSFVLPTGYSFNLDGTTLYLSLASIFLAQAGGIELSFGQQLLIVFTLMLTSKGVAGVARASLVILSGTAATFDLPEWPIAMILGVDVLMDMARTAVNVVGNCLASCAVAKWEGEFVPREFLADTPIDHTQ